MIIRQEQPTDYDDIFAVETAAFKRQDEAIIVEKLREADAIVLSLIAIQNNTIIGHAVYSKVTLKSEKSEDTAVALGPIAVHPDYQKSGVGGELIQAGNRHCRELGYDFVAVLGHPTYYPKFGFKPANLFNIYCEFEVPAEVFMILELKKGTLENRQGTIIYHTAFK